MFSFFDLAAGGEPIACAGGVLPVSGSLACALGTFDGVHIGHREIIRAAVASPYPACVFTFDRNPFGAPVLTPTEKKLRLFAECGARYAAVFDFEALRSLEAEAFVGDILMGVFNCALAVCGYNYRFGRDALGDTGLLCRLFSAAGRECRVIEPVTANGLGVSSSVIRGMIASGDVASANRLLGYPYGISLPVVHGRAVGRKLGFPTLNFDIAHDRALPAHGVYVTSCAGRPAVTNIGVRPTFDDGDAVTVETHVIDGECDLYGECVEVCFYQRLRDEKRFGSERELICAIERDKNSSLLYFSQKEG